MALRPCLICGALQNTGGSRCARHQIRRTRGRELQAIRRLFVIGRPCAICGEPADHLDHVTPLARGGTDHASNYAALCAACNLAKGDN